MVSLAIQDIVAENDTQARVWLNRDKIGEYAERMQAGDVFPPVVVFFDGKAYYLADGFHRAAAAEMAKRTEIDADVRHGSKRDATLYAVEANATHGIQRTDADKRRAVQLLLQDPEWSIKSVDQIAEKARVSGHLVRQVIDRMGLPEPTHRVGRNGRLYPCRLSASARSDREPAVNGHNIQLGRQSLDDPPTRDQQSARPATTGGRTLIPRNVFPVYQAAAKESQPRYTVDGVLVERSSTGQSCAVATDGRIMIAAEWHDGGTGEGEVSTIVPAASWKEAGQLRAPGRGPATAGVQLDIEHDGRLLLSVGDGDGESGLAVQSLGGQFPRWQEAMLNTAGFAHVRVNASDLAKVLNAVAAIAGDELVDLCVPVLADNQRVQPIVVKAGESMRVTGIVTPAS